MILKNLFVQPLKGQSDINPDGNTIIYMVESTLLMPQFPIRGRESCTNYFLQKRVVLFCNVFLLISEERAQEESISEVINNICKI